jgi:hypothetical protein
MSTVGLATFETPPANVKAEMTGATLSKVYVREVPEVETFPDASSAQAFKDRGPCDEEPRVKLVAPAVVEQACQFESSAEGLEELSVIRILFRSRQLATENVMDVEFLVYVVPALAVNKMAGAEGTTVSTDQVRETGLPVLSAVSIARIRSVCEPSAKEVRVSGVVQAA